MRDTIGYVMRRVFEHEGGYSNHPADPGGSTNMGITQNTLNGARRRLSGLPMDVRDLTKGAATRIYRQLYWNPVWGDELPRGVDYVVFDGAVNSGVHRSVQWLQRVVGTARDGVMGVKTLGATINAPSVLTIEQLCSVRRNFLRGLSTFSVFGRGWMNRVNRVEAGALKLAGADLDAVKERSKQGLRRTDKATGTTGAAGTAAGGGSVATLDGIGLYIAIAAGVVVVGSIVWSVIRHRVQAQRVAIIEEELS